MAGITGLVFLVNFTIFILGVLSEKKACFAVAAVARL